MNFVSDYLVSKQNMVAWHKYVSGDSSDHSISDAAGNGKTISCGAGNSPVLTPNLLNGQPGWYFNGTRDPLTRFDTSLTIKHAFVVASFSDATFSAYQGLLTGQTVGTPLVANNSGIVFLNNSGTYAGVSYRKNGVKYAMSVAKAPVNGVVAVVEIYTPIGTPFNMDGIQVGQNLANTSQLFNGYFFEQMLYSDVLGDGARMRMYQYFAKKYHLWEDAIDGGPAVFPFTSDWGANDPRKKIVLYDEAEDGSPTYRTKKAKKRYSEFGFSKRTQDEVDAVEAFYDQHHPGQRFVYRDRTVYPYSSITYRFAPDAELESVSPLGLNNFQYKLRMNEALDTVDISEPPPPAIPTGLRVTVLSDTSIRWDCDATADSTPPSVPVMTSPTGITDSEIVWNWLASTDDIAVTGYDLQVATDSGFTTGVRNIPLGNVLTYADTGRTDTTQYYARVRAHDAIPNNSAYSSSTNATTDAHVWSPADLGTDVFYWFEGDPLGLADGTTITTLVDQGPNNNDGTASGLQRPILKTAICNGHDVVRFDHSFIQHFALPDPSALTEANVFIVLKSTLAGGSYGIWKLGGTADESLYGFSGPNIYDIFGSTVRRGPFTVTSVSDAFHIYSVRAKTNFWENFFDGVSLAAADTTNTFILDATAYLGSSAVASSDSLDGDIAAFIMTSRDLTTTEWDNMISYLQTKFATP